MKTIDIESNLFRNTLDKFILISHIYFHEEIYSEYYDLILVYQTELIPNLQTKKISTIYLNRDFFKCKTWINLFETSKIPKRTEEMDKFGFDKRLLIYSETVQKLYNSLISNNEKENVEKEKGTESITANYSDWFEFPDKILHWKFVFVHSTEASHMNVGTGEQFNFFEKDPKVKVKTTFSNNKIVGTLLFDSIYGYLTNDFCTKTINDSNYMGAKCPKDSETCLMWRRKDPTGMECKNFLEKKDPTLINSTIVSFCNEYNYSTECDCYNRYNRKDYIYNKPNMIDHDYCWYTGCLSENLIINEAYSCNIKTACTTNYSFTDVKGNVHVENSSCNSNKKNENLIYFVCYYCLFCIICIFCLKILKG